MHVVDFAYSPPGTKSPWLGLRAGLEIMAIVGASIAAAVFAQRFILPPLGEALGAGGRTVDLAAATIALLKQFSAQYGTLFLVAAAVGLARMRRTPDSYAVGKGTLSGAEILRYGLVLGLIAGAPGTALLLVQRYAPVGAETSLWSAIESAPHDASFWAFMAVGSFGLVPLLEELTWRSYVLGRFSEALPPGAAILATALPFALLHLQYGSLDPAMLWALGAVLVLSFAASFATMRTGTIWPAVIAHAITNLPIEAGLGFLKLGAALFILVRYAPAIREEVRIWAAALLRRDSLSAIPALLLLLATPLAMLACPARYRIAVLAILFLVAAISVMTSRSVAFRARRHGRAYAPRLG